MGNIGAFMTTAETIQLVLGSGGILGILLGIAFLIFRTGKIVQTISAIGKDVNDLKNDVRDIRERVVYIEAVMFFSGLKDEPVTPANVHSERMKKSWEKRRSKQLEIKGK